MSLLPNPAKHTVPALLGPPLSACLSLNNLCRNHGAMDRHEYHSRSRSADQRPSIERPTSRSRSTERPHDSSLMRSMPSLPSGRSAPPSPALTRAHPRSGSVQTSPNSTPMSSRRGRQLPQLPSTGNERNGAGEECVAPQPQNGGP
ncbi:hypothetical protein JOQ06_025025, partial [Pogonophryne albipinna]